jgi:hypothetical protein
MGPALNALGVLVPAVTAITIALKGCPRQRHAVTLVLPVVTVWTILIGFYAVTQHVHGGAWIQCTVAAITSTIFLFTTKGYRRVVGSALLVGLGLLMIWHYQYLVGQPHYTGSRAIESLTFHNLSDFRDIVEARLENEALADQQFPVGAFTNELWESLGFDPEIVQKRELRVAQVHWRWWTPFTGIYGVQWRQYHLCYPGGLIKDARGRISVKAK